MPSMSGWALQAVIAVALYSQLPSFYALDIGLGFAGGSSSRSSGSDSGGVSMPSISGWALQGMLIEGYGDLGVCTRLRHPNSAAPFAPPFWASLRKEPFCLRRCARQPNADCSVA